MAHKPQELQSLGDRLRAARENLGLAPEAVCRELQIAPRFLAGLEENNLAVFPARVYALSFIRKLLALYTCDDAEREAILAEFDVEWDIRAARDRGGAAKPLPGAKARSVITPRRIAAASAALLFAGLAGFFALRIETFVDAPELSVTAPANYAALADPIVRVQGRAIREGRLTVNGRELAVADDGAFDEAIELSPGLNILEFILENRFGKKTTEVRSVNVR